MGYFIDIGGRNPPTTLEANMRIKITWEMTEGAATEAVMRAGAPSPADAATVIGLVRRSRHREVVPSGWSAGRISKEGYRIVGLEVVE